MTDLMFLLAGYAIIASVVYASMELIETYSDKMTMTETKLLVSCFWIIVVPIAVVLWGVYAIGNYVAYLVKLVVNYYNSPTIHQDTSQSKELEAYHLDDGTVIKTVEKTGIGWFTINNTIKRRKSADSGLAKWIDDKQPIKESKKK